MTHEKIDPELREFSKLFLPALKLDMSNLPTIRETFGATPLPNNVAIKREFVSCQSRSGSIEVLIFNLKPETEKPCIVHFHGGGFVLGDASVSAERNLRIALELDVTIVSVNYRLAPETNYQGSISDNYEALSWVYNKAKQLGIDRRRIAVMGESAGGGHAALLAIKARNIGDIDISFLALTYPMLDDRTGTITDNLASNDYVMWGPDANRFGWASFLGEEPGSNKVPTEAVPARIENLTNLPPTFIATGDLDLFYNESLAFADRLKQANVEVETLVLPGAFHCFDFVEEAQVTKIYLNALKSALMKNLNMN